MSDNIPIEIQLDIMNRLPVKSLIRFRSVSKSWKSLIHSSDFIARYSRQQQHLFVRYEDAVKFEENYVSIVDDDDDDHTFPQQKVSVTDPLLVNMLKHYKTFGSSHGLLCLFGETDRAVILNPSIRKSVDVVVPNVADDEMYRTVLGFWVCRETNDPKIVKITVDMESANPWQVDVFTLSTRAWRSAYSNNLPRKSIYIHWDQVVVDGCLYWLARDWRYNLIVSFDLTSEEFREVNLPDGLAHAQCSLSMYKLRESLESLVVIKVSLEEFDLVHHVWMMEDSVTKSFKKLLAIASQSMDVSVVRVRGFRKTGKPLIELQVNLSSTRILAAYEPYSKAISNVGINGKHFSVYSYMETLLLL